MLVVGLTGGIGSGKSTVANLFAELGVPIIDTDVIARDAVKPNSDALQQIQDQFGPEIIDQNGALNRQQMQTVVFENPQKKQWLENLLHPLIREQTPQQIAATQAPYCIVAIPLLAETGPNPLVNRVLVVDLDEALQLKRASARDENSEQQIRRIMGQQVSRTNRLAIADDVINNDQDIDFLREQVNSLHEKYLEINELT